MRFTIPSTAIGFALAAGAATAAHAQTVIAPAPVVVPAAMETVQTTETVRTIRPAHIVRRQVVTTRTVTRRIVPGPAVVASTAPRRLYDVVGPAPLTSSDDDYASPPLYDYASPRLYDVAAPAPVVGPAVTAAPFVSGYAEPFYRYVYEPDRILVIDPTTGIAVQAIPR